MSFAADLDAFLAEYGKSATLRRPVGSGSQQSYTDCNVQAFVKPMGTDVLAGSIGQIEATAIVSVTDITRAQWPGGQPVQSPPSAIDPRIPKLTDRLVFDGRERTIIGVMPKYDGDALYRIDLRIKG